MGEARALSDWNTEKPLYAAWGSYLRDRIVEKLEQDIAEPIDEFLKIPAEPRVKSDDSLRAKVQRKLRDEKPVDSIDDKVGVRFVVLLSEHIKKVEDAISSLDFPFTKDRDYEAEREARPLEFAYQSIHLVVRPGEPLSLGSLTVPANLACEVQIRTLLQHAHSELTHDRLYKAKKAPAQGLNRSVARSMALIEATDDIFTAVAGELDRSEQKLRHLMQHLDSFYQEWLGSPPQGDKYSTWIVGELLESEIDSSTSKIENFFSEKSYLIDNIVDRRQNETLYQSSAVLFAYFCLNESKELTMANWPLTRFELEDLGADVGVSFD